MLTRVSTKGEDRLTEGDAATDSNTKDFNVKNGLNEILINSDLDDNVPELVKIRLTSISCGTSDLLSRVRSEVKHAEAHPTSSPRTDFSSPPLDHRSYFGDDREAATKLKEKVLEIERPFKGHLIIPQKEKLRGLRAIGGLRQKEWEDLSELEAQEKWEDAPSSEKLAIDNIRDEWLKEKFYEFADRQARKF